MGNRGKERGFSLSETLIAAVIAAGVLAAAASSIGGSTQLTHATAERNGVLLEARTISARLKAGMSDESALQGFSGWRIQRTVVETERAETPIYFERISVVSPAQRFSFDILAPRSDG
ncbi:MAG: hypothetical protein AB7P23_05490 [Amphiplicatus sp.]